MDNQKKTLMDTLVIRDRLMALQDEREMSDWFYVKLIFVFGHFLIWCQQIDYKCLINHNRMFPLGETEVKPGHSLG